VTRLARAPLVLLAALTAGASGSPAPPTRDPGWDIRIAPPDEPGDSLIVTGVVCLNGRPAPGVSVRVYHADARGRYAQRADQPPRLTGVMRTDSVGRYRFRTILPMGYGGGPPHVHFEVWGPGIRRQPFLLEFAPPPGRATPGLVRLPLPPDAPRSDTDPFARRQTLHRDARGLLTCRFDMRLRATVLLEP